MIDVKNLSKQILIIRNFEEIISTLEELKTKYINHMNKLMEKYQILMDTIKISYDLFYPSLNYGNLKTLELAGQFTDQIEKINFNSTMKY
jgi:hypothetical protein